jgi:hypothetical protein
MSLRDPARRRLAPHVKEIMEVGLLENVCQRLSKDLMRSGHILNQTRRERIYFRLLTDHRRELNPKPNSKAISGVETVISPVRIVPIAVLAVIQMIIVNACMLDILGGYISLVSCSRCGDVLSTHHE